MNFNKVLLKDYSHIIHKKKGLHNDEWLLEQINKQIRLGTSKYSVKHEVNEFTEEMLAFFNYVREKELDYINNRKIRKGKI